MKLLSWNVNGFRAVHKKGFLDFFKKAKPDVLCLQETKCEPDNLTPEMMEYPGYGVEWHWSEKKGYCGVATFSKEKPLQVARGTNDKRFDGEGRVLVTTFKDLTLFNVYFPNGKSREERLKFKMDFYAHFLDLLESYRKRGQDKIVLCGDVNTAHQELDLARPKENRKVSGFLPMECAWIDTLLSRGYIDTFREFEKGGGHYSYWDQMTGARARNVGWRIDYFFISKNLRPRLKDAFILPDVMGSDHCPVGITLE